VIDDEKRGEAEGRMKSRYREEPAKIGEVALLMSALNQALQI